MNIKDLLKQAAGEVLTEDTLNTIETAFNTAVDERAGVKADEKTKERLTLEVESALTKQDEEHAGKLEKLLEAIDADHVKKLKAVVGKLDENHSNKLKYLVKNYRTQMYTEASKLRDTLTSQISNYLDLYLDKTVPADQLEEAVKNIQAAKMINEIKKVLVLDSSFITNEVREALLDGKQKISNLEKELDKRIHENVELNQKAKEATAQLLIETKTVSLPEDKKEYIKKVLADKDAEYINENFEYVVEMFERDQREEADLLRETANSRTISKDVDRPVAERTDEESATPVTGYLSELERFDNRK